MASVLIKHTVEDYDSWKQGFDAHADTRMEYGSEGYRLFRTEEDPNEIVMVFEWESIEKAQDFLENSDVRERMAELGVVGEPEIHFLDEIEAKTRETPIA